MELDAQVNVFELDTLWEQRQEALTAEEKSLKEYEKLDTEYRGALADLIDQALTKMQEDKTWLPYSMEVTEGSAIDVRVRILFSDITQEIVRRRDQERRQIKEAAVSTDAMVKELEAVRRNEEDEELKAYRLEHTSEPCKNGQHADCHVKGMNNFATHIMTKTACACDCHQTEAALAQAGDNA